VLPPDKVDKLREMLDGLKPCQCLAPAEESLLQGLARLVGTGRVKLLFPQEFNLVRGWTERCAACPERNPKKRRA
jgi:hypothetical protein